ncbi:MAG: MtrB/PioB family decaheme-associated outer membrane protein [Nitrospirota bacterium]
MKNKTFIYTCLMIAMLCCPARALEIEGDAGVKAMLVDVDGSEATCNEYHDLTDGLYGSFDIRYDGGSYYLDLKASDIGYDTQHYTLEGGGWGSFRYYLDYNEIPHNFTFDARTFYSGSGTTDLTGPPSTDVNSWSSFDYSIERRSLGGGIDLQMLKPFYISASVSREDRDGIKPTAVEGGIAFGNAVELPEPIDYRTDTLKVEAGYSKTPIFSSLSFIYSAFDNDNRVLRFDNPFIGGNPKDTLTLPPDNEYYKIAFKNALKLPLRSRFNMNLGYTQSRSDETLLNSFFEGGTLNTISLSDREFDGKIITENYDFVLTSSPLAYLEGKLFYKYHRRKNSSDEILSVGDETLVNEPLNYRKNRYGMELGFRLPASLHLLASYTHADTDRNREDGSVNKDDIYSVDLTWSQIEFLEVTVGYERISRTANFHGPEASPDEPEFLENFLRRFDVTAKDRDAYKAEVDIFPAENLTIGFGYRNEDTNYHDATLGLGESESDEFSINADYTLSDRVHIAGYYDFEKIKYRQVQRRVPFNATEGFDPTEPPTATAFNWTAAEKDRTYEYGIGADVHIIPKKLTLRLNHSSVKSDGSVDYTFLLGANPLPSGRTQDNIDLSDWDDYRLTSYLAKIIYAASSKINVSAGYIYEKFDYDDAQYDGYRNTIGTPVNTYLTGAYADQSYKADIVFVSASYRF